MKRFNSVLKLCFVAGFLVNPIFADASECGTVKSWLTKLGQTFNENWGYDECKEKKEELIITGQVTEEELESPTSDTDVSDSEVSANVGGGAVIAGATVGAGIGAGSGVGSGATFSLLDSLKEKGLTSPEEKRPLPSTSGYMTDGRGNVVFVDGKPLSNDPDRYELIFAESTNQVLSVNDKHRQVSYVPWMVSTKPESEVPLVLKTWDYDDYDRTTSDSANMVADVDLTATQSTEIPVQEPDEPQEESEIADNPEEHPEGRAKSSSPYTDDDPGTLSPAAKQSCAEGPIRVGVHSMACIDEYNRAQAEKGQATMSTECGSDFIGPLLPGQCDTPSLLPEAPASREETDEEDKEDELPFPDEETGDEDIAQTMSILSEEPESTDETVDEFVESGDDESWRDIYEPSPGDDEESDGEAAVEVTSSPSFSMFGRSYSDLDAELDLEEETATDEPADAETDAALDKFWSDLDEEAEADAGETPVNTPDLTPANVDVSDADKTGKDDTDKKSTKSADDVDVSADDVVINGLPVSELDNADSEDETGDVFASDSNYSVESLEKMDSYVRNNMTVVEAQSVKDKESGVHVRSVVMLSEDGGEEVEVMGGGLTTGGQKLSNMQNKEIEAIAAELGVSSQQIESCKKSMANRDTSGRLENLSDAEAIRKCLTSHIMLFSDELVITQEQYIDVQE